MRKLGLQEVMAAPDTRSLGVQRVLREPIRRFRECSSFPSMPAFDSNLHLCVIELISGLPSLQYCGVGVLS